MNKELIDHVWKHCLPKEFREEVKKEWQTANNEERLPHDAFLRGCYSTMALLFGYHNLTSDADGEEMLTVPRSKVQEVYKTSKEIVNNEQYGTCQYSMHTQIMCVLENLFGSKCLPDEPSKLQASCWQVNEDNFAKTGPKAFKYKVGQKVILHFYGGEVSIITEAFNDGGVWNKYKVKMLPTRVWNENELDPYEEPKPAEQRLKVGDMVRFKYCCTPYRIDGFKMLDGAMLYQVGEVWAEESDLEPYTEPREDLIPSNSGELKSQEADNQSRNLSKNIEIFDKSNCNRLTIAAMAMQGILSNAERMKQYGEMAAREPESLTELVARNALRYADALIDKVKKGVNDE